jgi:hypothetical protein
MTLSREQIKEISQKWSIGMSPEQINDFVVNSHVTKSRKIKQALLECENRFHNFDKLVVQHKRTLLEIKKLEHEIENCEDPFQKESLMLDLEDRKLDNSTWKRKSAALISELDVFVEYLQSLDMTEEELEKHLEFDHDEERTYWVARLGKQAALDIVAHGRIGVGNMDSISMLKEEDQIATLQVAVQYSGLLNVGISKIHSNLLPYLKELEKNPTTALPTFHGIEDNLEVPLLNKLKGDINEFKSIQSSNKSET